MEQRSEQRSDPSPPLPGMDPEEQIAFLNSILESPIEYAIIGQDFQGNILTWNEGARHLYRYSAKEVVGKANSRILHSREDIESGRVDKAFGIAFRTGKFEGEFQGVRKIGPEFTAHVSITLRRDGTGKPAGYVVISRDISRQKLVADQLRRRNEELEEENRRVREANRLKSEFMANMSHELRTPLNGIIGCAEIMHDGKVGPVSSAHKEFLGDILASARHQLRLINDLLDLARVESGKMEFHPEAIDLTSLVGEVRGVLRTIISQKRMRIETDIDPKLGVVVADASKLKQVLYNYLSNALKFTQDEGRIRIRVRPEGPEAFRLEVEDNGTGIDPQDHGRLFVEFQQLDATVAKHYPGSGLGLALTKQIVEVQGGRVGAESRVGNGSVFFAILPRRAMARDERRAA